MEQKETEQYRRLLGILDRLREECPWDKKQTFDSLRSNTIEECFELCDALSNMDMKAIKEELGDLLLHIIFYSKMAEEQGAFNIEDVAECVSDKLVYRHPHVFSTAKVGDADEVVKNWESLKIKEKKQNTSVLSGVPRSLPSLIKSFRIQQKAAGVGFDWENKVDVWNKVKEELAEVDVEIETGTKDKQEEEFGDLLFSIINAARKYDIDPETALERCNKKFIKRFQYIETHSNKPIDTMSLPEMELLWNEAKSI